MDASKLALILLFYFTTNAIGAPRNEECPEGWLAFEARCFYFSHLDHSHALNWYEAEQKCLDLAQGSTLASIRSRAEQDFVETYANETAFIGGTDAHQEGDWIWLDKSPLDFTNWASGEPGGGSGENCLELVPNKGGTWNDVPCEASHAVKAAICSMDAAKEKCFVKGECKRSTLLSETTSLSQNGCLKFCQSVEGCTWFTYHQDQNLCLAMKDCTEFETDSCNDCFSGQHTCEKLDLQCWVKGICQGRLITEVPTTSAEHCLEHCLKTADCRWFSFEHVGSGCFLFEDCPILDESRLTSITSSASCRGKTSMTKILVGLGNGGDGPLDSLELIDLDTSTSCTASVKFPQAKEEAFGGLGPSSQPLICGGLPANNECHVLANGKWLPFRFMHKTRAMAAVAPSPYPTAGHSLMVTGGYNGTARMESSEVLVGNEWQLKDFKLPIGISRHCLVQIGHTSVMTIGGLKTPDSSHTHIFDSNVGKWVTGPHDRSRHSHSCARIRRGKDNARFSTIVVGGYDDDYLGEVAILDDADADDWRCGPDLPVKIANATLIEDPAGGVILIGGRSSSVDVQDAVYRLAHAGPEASWVKMPVTLETARHAHIAFLVPDNTFECASSSLSSTLSSLP